MEDESVLSLLINESEDRKAKLREELAFEERYSDKLAQKLSEIKGNRVASIYARNHKAIELLGLVNNQQRISCDAITTQSAHVVPGSIASTMADIFREHDKNREGLDVEHLVKKLEERGKTTTANSGMTANVYSTLSKRDDLFEKVSRGVYRLKLD